MERGGKNNQLLLMLGDVDNIKGYVYETSKLPEIRGASEILNELYSDGIREIFNHNGIPEDHIIYSGGGTFLAWVPAAKAEKVKKEIEREYIEKTGIATISVAYSPLRRVSTPTQSQGFASRLLDGYLNSSIGGEFSEGVTFLLDRLRLEKMNKNHIPFYPSLPVMKRCAHCGKRGAGYKIGDDIICMVCKKKRKYGNKKRFVDEFNRWSAKKGKGVFISDDAVPETLGDIGNYVAFVYADGNGIGELLLKARSEEEYKNISEQLSRGVRNAVFESLHSLLETEKSIPFEIINIGGDDVSLFISARYAWSFTVRFLENFKNNLKALADKLDHEITASAGVVIAKYDFPVIFSERLAEGLLRIAKERGGSSICHLYLRSHIAETNAKSLLEDYYLVSQDNIKYSLTMRPFSLDEAKELERLSHEFERLFSTSQRKAFTEVLSTGIWKFFNFFAYQIGRMNEADRRSAFQFVDKIKNIFGLKDWMFFSSSRDTIFSNVSLSSPILDLIELIDFSQKE